MCRADPVAADMLAISYGEEGGVEAVEVEAGLEMQAVSGAGTAISIFGNDEIPLIETREVASETAIANEKETVSVTETEIAIGTGNATEIGVIATRTGLADHPRVGADRHPRATFVDETSHLAWTLRGQDMDHEMGAPPLLAPRRPTHPSAWRRSLAAASDAGGLAAVATGMVEGVGGAIMTTATWHRAAGLKRAAGRVTVTTETGGTGFPTQTYGGGIGTTVIPVIENCFGQNLTAAHSPMNLHL